MTSRMPESKPNKTPLRAIRISDEIWHAAQARAEAEGTTVSDVVRKSLKRYGAVKISRDKE